MTTKAPEALIYKCPHCQGSIEIGQQLFGETVDCPKCDAPFQVEPPKAVPTGEVAHERSDQDNRAELSDEEVTESVIHPVVFRRHLFGTLISLVALVGGITGLILYLTESELFGLAGLWIAIPSVILLVVSLFFLLQYLIMSRMQSLTLTSERLIYRYGIIHRDTSEMRYDDVRNLQVEQNLVERLLNFGDIALSSAGQDDMEIVIHDIPAPQDVADAIRKRQ